MFHFFGIHNLILPCPESCPECNSLLSHKTSSPGPKVQVCNLGHEVGDWWAAGPIIKFIWISKTIKCFKWNRFHLTHFNIFWNRNELACPLWNVKSPTLIIHVLLRVTMHARVCMICDTCMQTKIFSCILPKKHPYTWHRGFAHLKLLTTHRNKNSLRYVWHELWVIHACLYSCSTMPHGPGRKWL